MVMGGGSVWGAGGGMRGGHPGAAAGGLPFAGIPSELQERAQKILDTEPEHPEPDVEFSHRSPDERPFTLKRFISPHRWAILAALALVAVEIVTEQIGPRITGLAIDHAIVPRNLELLLVAVAAYAGAILVNILTRRVRIAYSGRVGELLMYRLRLRVFAHLERLSLDFYTEEKSGRIMTRMTSDIEALTMLFHDGLINLAVQAVTLVVVLAVLFTMNVNLALFTTLFVVPLMVLMSWWFRSASDKAFLSVRDRIAEVLSDLAENLAGIRVVAAFNRHAHNLIRHRNVVGDHRDANVKGATVSALYGSGVEGIGYLGQVLILVVGGNMVRDGSLTPGHLTAFFLYLSSFFAPIQQLVQLYSVYQQGRAAIVKLRELQLMQPSVPEAPDARELPPITGEITLEGITFGYDPSEPVLADVDLRIEAGETFALVGPTGAGKSTIAKLITRFYDPQSGKVSVDGHDIEFVTLTSLRRQIGVVPQEPFLFATSLRDNIAFARPDATDEQVMEACRAVGIEDLIERLPLGLETPCHERGVTLSSGERQLIALARAFLAEPRVLVLDEATSNLDLGTERKVERALDILLEGRTAVLIAHRLSTAMRADRIAVVDHGRLIEVGSHDELMERGGRYAEMFETWLSHGQQAQAHA